MLTLVANDGSSTFLGNATSNPSDVNGVCDSFGLYGSSTSITSIHDSSGLYGSTSSIWSAYSTSTVTPPFLKCASTGATLNAVTKNQAIPNGIDPDALCAALASAGY